ncbi:MAG: sigma-70 family RNA polymerase sigma factor [Clostridia bacterium]|nr:sigma-70 family RNA polymerase sigma factor [Clostridia bacterium]MDY6183930.1 sigma-70 family RNA polymerase sigma factor [Eubacteriales bacterium]
METKKPYAENTALLERSRQGDEKATEALMLANGGLVRNIAARFEGRGVDAEDLFQIGFIGLLKAIRTFDPSRACAFSTYAVPLIFGEIRRHLRDEGPIKVSRTQKRLAAMLAREREQAIKRGENPRIEDLAAACGVTPAEAAVALDAMAPIRSLSETLFGEEDGPTLDDTVTDEDEAERTFHHLALSMSIDKLSPLRKKIILLRYWRDLSQQQVADQLGLTQVKVSREEKKIIAFLREELS